MPAIDCTRYFPPGNSGTSAYHQRESADGLSFLLHPRFSCGWFFSFESMCDIVKLSSVRGRKHDIKRSVASHIGLQFIPARGRKPSVVCPCFLVSNEFPARGRKLCALPAAHDAVLLQFIPARGRKLHNWIFRRCHSDAIPARGQQSTSATGVCQQRRCFAFSYILLYRLGAAPAGIVFVTGSALTPCGTSGFMGRISCR